MADKIVAGNNLSVDDARRIVGFNSSELIDLIALANRVRVGRKGDGVFMCAIINARSGSCSEDCAFCAQSVHYETNAPEYELVSAVQITDAAQRAKKDGAVRFSIVTSGLSLDADDEVAEAVDGIRGITELGMRACASVGVLSKDVLLELKEAGLTRYHHNLETAPSFFDKICTTHRYEEDVETIKAAKSLGIETCCGGIFGLGESWDQRLEFLYLLVELEPTSVPINFLIPIPGTPLEGISELTPSDCVKIIALARLILPDADIVLCGGREVNLRDMQGTALLAGASGLMVGDYLTTPGRSAQLDCRMIEDAGFVLEVIR